MVVVDVVDVVVVVVVGSIDDLIKGSDDESALSMPIFNEREHTSSTTCAHTHYVHTYAVRMFRSSMTT